LNEHAETGAGSVDVSVVIVSYNTREVTRNCLRSVYEQTSNISFEVFVVDNQSRDGSPEMVRTEFPEVILIANEENRGFAAANNQALRLAKGRYFLLLNSDTVVLDRAIEKTVDYADRRPRVGVVGCQVLEDENTVQQTCFSFPSLSSAFFAATGLSTLFPRSRLFGREWIGWWNRDTEREVDVVSGMFMLARKEAVDQVGLMDEDYFIYAEEADWCFRLWKAGWPCVFAPVARILHLEGGGKSTRQVSAKMYLQLQKSLLLFHRKNRGLLSWAGLKALYILNMGARALLFRAFCVLRLGRSACERARLAGASFRYHLFGVEPTQ